VPRCRYLVIVDDIKYGRALVGFAFGVIHNLPDVSSSFARETVPHLDVTDWRFGVVALRAGIAERRWGLAGDLHAAVRHEQPLAHGDRSLARLRTQSDPAGLDTRLYEPLEVLQSPL
jgi:hypothetical protein